MIQDQNFGIEIEMTGITREQAAQVIAEYFGTNYRYIGGYYKKYEVTDNESRKWILMSDSSIKKQIKCGRGEYMDTQDGEYSVELVSPICKYKDIKTIQEIVRQLRKKGAIANDSTGIHVHIDASKYDAKSLRNLTNIMRSKEDLLYKALQVNVEREYSYCKKVDENFIQELNTRIPSSKEDIKKLWYKGSDGSGIHYHTSRYHALNLHAVFSKGTIEFRLFNGTMHAGKIKTYIQLSLAISNQALTQKRARYERTNSTNEKYTFRTWLLRLGMIGKEFETARMFLLEHLEGNIAWKDPTQIEKQKQRLAQNNNQLLPDSSEVPVCIQEQEIQSEMDYTREGMML